MVENQNAYSVLGIKKGSTEQQIKLAYISLVKKYDPESSSNMFMKIQAAYEKLKTPGKRAKEDLFTYNYVRGTFQFNSDERVKGGSGDWWRELAQLKEKLKADPLDAKAKVDIIRCYMRRSYVNVTKKLWAEAIKDWHDVLSQDPTHTHAKNNLIYSFITLGYSYAVHGLLKEALDMWDKALQMDPDNHLLVHNLAIASELGGEREKSEKYWAEVIRHWKGLLNKSPNDDYLKSLLIEMHKHFGGRALDVQKNTAVAIKEYKEILKINPDDFDAHFQIASTLMEEQKWDESIEELTKLSKRYNKNIEVLNLLGWALLNGGRVDNAFNTWRKCLAVDKKNTTTYENIKRAHWQIGRKLRDSGLVTNALVHFKSLLRYEPKNWEVHYDIAKAYQMKGDIRSAITEYNVVLGLDPKNKDAKKALSDLRMRRNA